MLTNTDKLYSPRLHLTCWLKIIKAVWFVLKIAPLDNLSTLVLMTNIIVHHGKADVISQIMMCHRCFSGYLNMLFIFELAGQKKDHILIFELQNGTFIFWSHLCAAPTCICFQSTQIHQRSLSSLFHFSLFFLEHGACKITQYWRKPNEKKTKYNFVSMTEE